MRAGATLLCVLLCAAAAGQEDPDPIGRDPDLAGIAIRWDDDFDLILEYRQGDEQEAKRIRDRVRPLQDERDLLAEEVTRLEMRRQRLEGSYSTEMLLEEMLDLNVKSASEAIEALEERIAWKRERMAELDREMQRARRGRAP